MSTVNARQIERNDGAAEFIGQRRKTRKLLDIGCGRNKIPGAVGIDKGPLPGVAVIHDLNSYPYPFDDDSFDEIYAIRVIEQLDSLVSAMEEIHPSAKPDGKVIIVTPRYSGHT